MAHELHRDAQGYRMFYVKGSEREKVSNRPWHAELTNPIGYDAPPSIEQAVKDLRADVEIKLRPVFDQDGNLIPTRQEIWRPNLDQNGNQIQIERPNQPGSFYPSGDSLEIVGPEYQILQDSQLIEVFRPWVENNLATLETGGAIFGGRGFWIMAKLNQQSIKIAKDDVIQPYFLASNFHGGFAANLRPTEIRVVCNNTLSAAHRASKSLYSIRHQGNISFKLEEAQILLKNWNILFERNADVYREMAKWKFKSSEQIEKYFQLVLRKPEKEFEEGQESEEKQEEEKIERNKIQTALRAAFVVDSKKLPQNGQSLWRAFNAITDYVTHSRGRDLDKRVANMFSSKNLATYAFDLTTKILAGKIELEHQVKVQVPANKA